MAFDGNSKTDEPKIPEGMAPVRIAIGYTKHGNPVGLICDMHWNGVGLREKCELEHYNSEDDGEPDNSDLIPVSHVQRIMLFMPTQPPAAKVTKAMDISGLMTVSDPPVDIEAIAPDAPDPTQYKWE